MKQIQKITIYFDKVDTDENIVNIFVNDEAIYTFFTNKQNQIELINKRIKEIINHENEN